jgi:predicted site-specific integrase-resolvase|tara:strand:+ start:84 stop:287 length:204 start_codon:yes stop_codon:yes gene_type:complete
MDYERLEIKCQECGHDNELMGLVESAHILKVHPESLRRYVRYGQVNGMAIERGRYFLKSDLEEFSKI